MDIYAGLEPEAKQLIHEHSAVVARLPLTFLVFTLVDIRKWSSLFQPEQKYFRALFDQLSAFDNTQFENVFGDLSRFEVKVGCDRAQGADAMTARGELENRLRSKGAYAEWRRRIDSIFEKLEPLVDARVYAPDDPAAAGPRLVVMVYGQGIAIERESLWKRFREVAVRIPLSLGAAQTAAPFLAELFTGLPASAGANAAPTLFQALASSKGYSPLDTWIIEAGDELHALCEQKGRETYGRPGLTGLSYHRLRAYRERLSDAIYSKVTSANLSGPLELEAWLENLDAKPQEGLTLHSAPVVLDFVRDILVLGGNGSLIINNSFVEWSSVRALERAHPRVLVARFGVRDKLKPFSSLLLFSKPRSNDVFPIMEDPLGSFVDVELLSYYIWLKSSPVLPYKGKTMYVLAAEGVDEVAVVPPGGPKETAKPPVSEPVSLSDVAVTMAAWLGTSLEHSPGKPLEVLLA
jgi:hypothetical protein